MLKTAVLSLALIVVAAARAGGQDIAGIEDCTRTTGLDRRTSCLQSNINFLQQLITKNSLDARQRLSAATAEILALKSVVTSLQASVQQLQAAQKALEKRPEGKDKKPPDK